MVSLVSALIVCGVLAILHPSTRWLGILCLLILCYLSPILSAFLVVLIVGHLFNK